MSKRVVAFFMGVVACMTLCAARAENAGCQPLYDATLKTGQVPSHEYMTRVQESDKSSVKHMETINLPAGNYLFVNGKWRKSPITMQQRLAMVRKGMAKGAKDVCSYVRDESVNGEPAALYSARHADEDSKSDSLIWVSKRTGLVLQKKTEIDVGGSAAGKSHDEVRYEYTNVSPPAGVR